MSEAVSARRVTLAAMPPRGRYALSLADDALIAAQRMAHRRRAHDDGAWVRAAATAYAARREVAGREVAA